MIRLALLSLLLCALLQARVTPSSCTARNEEFRERTSPCELTCENKDERRWCTRNYAFAVCRCKAGFYRSDSGECVTYDQCSKDKPTTPKPKIKEPICTRANEVVVHSHENCFPTCATRIARPRCPRIHDPIGSCQCRGGYLRAENGECVTIDKCEEEKPALEIYPMELSCTRANEVPRSDPRCWKTCADKDKFVNDCASIRKFLPECQCDDGFYRSGNGECVTYEQCSDDKPSTSKPLPQEPICKRVHEVVVHSHENCFPKCATRNAVLRCPRIHDPIGSCQCRGGYLRAENGECVTIDKCDEDKPKVTAQPAKPKCTRANEILRSDLGCVRSCSDKDEKLFDCAWGRSAPECACAHGFYRSGNGDCVTYAQCDIELI